LPLRNGVLKLKRSSPNLGSRTTSPLYAVAKIGDREAVAHGGRDGLDPGESASVRR